LKPSAFKLWVNWLTHLKATFEAIFSHSLGSRVKIRSLSSVMGQLEWTQHVQGPHLAVKHHAQHGDGVPDHARRAHRVLEEQNADHHGVAVQVAFESKGLKAVAPLKGSRVETRRFQAVGALFSTCTAPHHRHRPLGVAQHLQRERARALGDQEVGQVDAERDDAVEQQNPKEKRTLRGVAVPS
jgi:hypothetical protein